MNIYIDLQSNLKQKTGISYYNHNLIKYLQKIDHKNKYKLFVWKIFLKKQEKPIAITNHNFSYKSAPAFLSRIYRKLFKLGIKTPFNLFIGSPDLYIALNFIAYPIWKSKSICVIYDLSYLKFPQFVEPKNVKFLTKMVPKSVQGADHIITISENSKKEIIENYKVSEEKLSIIYPATDLDFFQPQKQQAADKIKNKYNIGQHYLLFASTLEPRKNVVGIIKAYSSLPQEIQEKYDLVLAGGKGWQDREIWQAIEKAKERGLRIVTPGYIPEKDLPALYSGAYLFLYPSFYEGFGIPILEAMSCGLPVITSNTSSMPEVAGDAAILINPENPEELKDAIIRLSKDQGLRESLIQKGYQQTKRFSWQKSAEKFLALAEKINQS